MKNDCCSKCIRITKLCILSIITLAALYFYSDSAFKNALSFRNRSEYIYQVKPENYNGSDKFNESDQKNCSFELTDTEKKFINKLDTQYHFGIFISTYAFGIIGFIFSTLVKFDFKSEKAKAIFNVLATISYYFCIVFSSLGGYSSRVYYGDCVEVEGMMLKLMNNEKNSLISGSIWLIFFFLIGFFTLLYPFDKKENETLLTLARCYTAITGLYSLGYIIFAIILKFWTTLYYQLAYNILLVCEFIYGAYMVFQLDTPSRNRVYNFK